MNRKQGFIIATLLVLIVCAGILATKVNSPLYVDSSEITNASVNDKGDFFTESKLNREQTNARDLPTYKTIMDDPSAAKETKDAMTLKFKTLTTNTENEQKIEGQLKGKGYDDAFCQIVDEKVNVYVKTKDKQLTDKQLRDIKNLVLGVTKIKDVEVAAKQ